MPDCVRHPLIAIRRIECQAGGRGERAIARSSAGRLIVARYVGLDVSNKDTAIHVADDTGRLVWRGKTATEPEVIAAALRRHALSLRGSGSRPGSWRSGFTIPSGNLVSQLSASTRAMRARRRRCSASDADDGAAEEHPASSGSNGRNYEAHAIITIRTAGDAAAATRANPTGRMRRASG
jgi:hypothetical protein